MQDQGEPRGSTARLLRQVTAFITRFVVITDEEAALLATWVLHTYTLAAAQFSPYVLVTSATKGCGKTTLLAVLREIVRNPLVAASISPAVSYRVIEAGNEPTMLLDELDQRRTMNEDLRAIINAGFTRNTLVYRMQDGVVTGFPAFCPKALAGIGHLDPTIVDRGFQIKMRRRLRTNAVPRFRPSANATTRAAIEGLHEELESWAGDALGDLIGASPEMPDDLDDRACDVFEPLFSIADLAGGEWSERVRQAGISNRTENDNERLDAGAELLRDLRDLWAGNETGFVPSREIVAGLVIDAELRWATYGRGNAILTERALALLLDRFGIKSVRAMVNDPRSVYGRMARGYKREQFQEPFARYLDPLPHDAAEGTTEDKQPLIFGSPAMTPPPGPRGRVEAHQVPDGREAKPDKAKPSGTKPKRSSPASSRATSSRTTNGREGAPLAEDAQPSAAA